jgi:hypothetical protein
VEGVLEREVLDLEVIAKAITGSRCESGASPSL